MSGASSSQAARVVVVGWLLPGVVTLVAAFVFINGSLSAWNADHVDLSINLTAAHALYDGDNPYGWTALAERAKELGGPTELIYGQLFTSYIQPPTSALHLLPLVSLDWRDATHVYFLLNHVFLLAAVSLTLYTVRPTLPWPWVVAGAAVILAAYACIPFSLALGQVDPTVVFLLSIGYWGYARGHAPVTGTAIACAAAIKLIPAVLLLYFLWKREYRVVAWGAGVGLALLLVSVAYVGTDVYNTYLTDTLPMLTKGSSHYSNIALNAIVSRAATPPVINGIPESIYLGEVPSHQLERFVFLGIEAIGLLAIALVTRPSSARASAARPPTLLLEYYFVVALALLISSSTWDFYVIWLLPAYLAVFLAPDRVLPGGRERWIAIGLLALAFIGMNYPGDFYLFAPNDFFYHPDLVPGKWVEDHVGLYHNHLDAVILLRLPSLLLFASTLGWLIVRARRSEVEERTPAPIEATLG